MAQQKIQQQIASFVPEFNGADTPYRTDELTRFLGTADSIYETLETEAARKTFARLIKFRLSGDAYTRIARRPTEDYKKLRSILNDLYSQTFSLEELERNFTSIHQTYGETIRSYGYRLIEALEQYKNGFQIKYVLGNIDEAYEKHLDRTAVQTFKRGLNNTILQEKIATHKANNVEEIIEKADMIERMLLTTTNTPIRPTIIQRQQESQSQSKNIEQPKTTVRVNQITCNYCEKPNHTWDVCRTRIYAEERAIRTHQHQTTPYQTNIRYTQNRGQYQSQIRQQPKFYPQKPQETRGYLPPQRQTTIDNYAKQNNYMTQRPRTVTNEYNQQGNTPNRHIPQQYHNDRQTQNQSYFRDRPMKYCSYCKTTIGLTFDECRNKYQTNHNHTRNNTPYNNQIPQQQPPDGNIEKMFGNMRINMIAPQQQEDMGCPQDQQQPQGNANGSNQS